MNKTEKYHEIGRQVEALQNLVRCNHCCLSRNLSGHDDTCAITLANYHAEKLCAVVADLEKNKDK